jgi:predicted nucleic acid-binding Zn ribbon protein
VRPSEFAYRQRQVLNHLEKAAAILAEMEAPTKRGRSLTADEETRQQAIVQLALDEPELTFAEVGRRFGISRQRVDQILKKNGIGAERTEQARAARRATEAKMEEQERKRWLAERAEELGDRTCVACYRPIPVERDRRAVTCSKRCKRLWDLARIQLDPELYERHRRHNARSILAHPEGKNPAHIDWAKRMLNGEQPPPNRRFTVRGSAAGRAVQEIKALRERVA